MSSKTSKASLDSSDLQLLQDVLLKAGYSGDVSVYPPRRPHNAAAKLLIGLLQSGTRDPVELTAALETAFGRQDKPAVLYTRGSSQHSLIQGRSRS